MKSSVHIRVGVAEGTNVLLKSFYTPPFRIADISENRKSELRLMFMSSSPGILDGDDFEIKVEVGKDASLQLATQSFQRIYQMNSGAQQHMEVEIHSGGSLVYLPHPVVPHKNSLFSSSIRFDINENASLIYGEVLTPGRKMCGEIFQFKKFRNLTEIFMRHHLVYRENIFMFPQEQQLNALGLLEGFTHQASWLMIDKNITGDIIDKVYDYLEQKSKITFGITAMQVPGFVVRLLGHSAEELYDCLKHITCLAGIDKKEIVYAG
jgi:urease accessory protein